MLGITLGDNSLMGDKLQFASFPENYYRNTGEKVIDLDCLWIYDHNPFVVRGRVPTQVMNLKAEPWPQLLGHTSVAQFLAKPIFFSSADRTACIFNHIAYLRHPRLYAYEDLPTINNRIVIHTTGRTFDRTMKEDQPKVLADEIMHYIRIKYRNYDLIQVGSKDDADAHVVDCRGLQDIWETVKIIAQAGMFIGVDSGPSWIAASYPAIFRKKVLMQYSPEFLRTSFIPMHLLIPHQHWYDASFIYYNRSKDDAGITYSYLKL